MESGLAQAERHVQENAVRIARQRTMLAEMNRDNHPQAAAIALRVLETMLETQRLALQHLEIEKLLHGEAAPSRPAAPTALSNEPGTSSEGDDEQPSNSGSSDAPIRP